MFMWSGRGESDSSTAPKETQTICVFYFLGGLSMTDPVFLKNIIIEKIKTSSRYGDIRIYKMVLDFFSNNQDQADQFMLSSFGGYEENELSDIKLRMSRNKKKYNLESKASCQVQAF